MTSNPYIIFYLIVIQKFNILGRKYRNSIGIIVLYGWKVNVQEQNEIVGELHIPRENFTFPRS